MKAMVLEQYNTNLKMKDVSEPTPGPRDLILKVHKCGICGTDLKIVFGKLPQIISLPHIPGHEIVGEIVDKGKDVEKYSRGDMGVVYFYISCGDCEMCRTGRENICFNIKRLGFELNGGYAEYVRIPAYSFCPVEDSSVSTSELAVLPDAIATPYHSLKSLAECRAGQKILIVGAGGFGLHAVQIASMLGTQTAVADLREESLLLAKDYGAEVTINPLKEDPCEIVMSWTKGKGVDVVLEGVGREKTFSWSHNSHYGITITLIDSAALPCTLKAFSTSSSLNLWVIRISLLTFPEEMRFSASSVSFGQ